MSLLVDPYAKVLQKFKHDVVADAGFDATLTVNLVNHNDTITYAEVTSPITSVQELAPLIGLQLRLPPPSRPFTTSSIPGLVTLITTPLLIPPHVPAIFNLETLRTARANTKTFSFQNGFTLTFRFVNRPDGDVRTQMVCTLTGADGKIVVTSTDDFATINSAEPSPVPPSATLLQVCGTTWIHTGKMCGSWPRKALKISHPMAIHPKTEASGLPPTHHGEYGSHLVTIQDRDLTIIFADGAYLATEWEAWRTHVKETYKAQTRGA